MASLNGNQCYTPTGINIFYNTRLFLREMVYWSVTYFNSVFNNIGSEEDVFGRLYYTPTSYILMLRMILPKQTADRFGFLFGQYIIILRELVTAVINGNQELVNQKAEELYKQLQEVSDFIWQTFPGLDKEVLSNLFADYVRLEIETINAYIAHDYSGIIEIYDKNIENAENIADYLSQGIINLITAAPRIPSSPEDQNRSICVNYDEMQVILNITLFWVELVSWFRAYRVSVMADIGNQEQLYERLIKVTVDFGNLLKTFMDPDIVDIQIQLIQEYIVLVDEMLKARINNDIDEMNRFYKLAVDNIHQRAEFLGEVFPGLSAEEWESRLIKMHSTLIQMGGEFLSGNYALNIALFDDLIDQAADLGFIIEESLFGFF